MTGSVSAVDMAFLRDNGRKYEYCDSMKESEEHSQDHVVDLGKLASSQMRIWAHIHM